MEISSSGVSYQLSDVTSESYNAYIKELLEEGYVMVDNGIFTRNGYNITTTLNVNGDMTISLNKEIYL